MRRTVTLADKDGNITGISDLIQAHTGTGKLHLAFSVYIFNPERTSLLLQRRSLKKMLWPGIWANTCCSHPFENESPLDAGERRLKEEMGIVCELKKGPAFVYRAEDPAGRGMEYEHVTTLVGMTPETDLLKPDPEEAMDWKWMEVGTLVQDFKKHPDIYAPWFPIGLKKILENG